MTKPHHLSREGRELAAKAAESKNNSVPTGTDVLDSPLESKPQDSQQSQSESAPKISMTPEDLKKLLEENTKNVTAAFEEKLKNLQPQQQVQAPQSAPQTQFVAPLTGKQEFDQMKGLPELTYEDRVYVMVDGSRPSSVTIQNKHKKNSPLQWFNPETKETLSIRYATNQRSPFMEHQQGDAITEYIVIRKGELRVPKENRLLQLVLAIHPSNGAIFKELNRKVEAQKEVDAFENIMKAQRMAMELPYNDLETILRIVYGASYQESWSTSEVKATLYKWIPTNAARFLQLAEDDTLKYKGYVKTAQARGLISYENFEWLDSNGKHIIAVDRMDDEDSVMAMFLMTNSGSGLKDYIEMQLN